MIKKAQKHYSAQEENSREEVLQLNEALQHLTRKKDRSEKAKSSWKQQSHANTLISKTLNSFGSDPKKPTTKSKDEGKHGVTKAESKMAQELAMELAMGVDVKKDKAKKQT